MPETPLWTSEEIAQATGGRATGGGAHGAPFAVCGLDIDTRTLKPGDLFVALSGARDGHDYVDQAMRAGAAGVLASRPVGEAPAVIVDDTLRGIERLAAAARDRSSARRCAVTGSVGKTGVTQAIAAALKLAGKSHAPVKSFNNHIGVPLTLAALPRDAEFAVFELGMNHSGEIGPLSRLVQPHVAVVTTVGPVHVENFPDGEAGVARAKAEIFEGLAPGGVAVLNAENQWYRSLARQASNAGAKIRACGLHPNADAQLLSLHTIENGLVVEARINGNWLRYPLKQQGTHWGLNSLLVILAVDALGIDLNIALHALNTFEPLVGRGTIQRIAFDGGTITLIDESYNANPVSMRAALDTLGRAGGRRIAVLTDMLELGPEATRHHAELAGPIRDAGVETTYLAGPSMRHLHDALDPGHRGVWAESAEALVPAVVAGVRAGDTVMVKGSNGSNAGLIVRALLAQGSAEADA